MVNSLEFRWDSVVPMLKEKRPSILLQVNNHFSFLIYLFYRTLQGIENYIAILCLLLDEFA